MTYFDFDNDADWDMLALEEAGDRTAHLKDKGVCVHGWWQGNKCLDCGKVFENEAALLAEYGARMAGDFDMVDTGEDCPQYTFAPKNEEQLSLF